MVNLPGRTSIMTVPSGAVIRSGSGACAGAPAARSLSARVCSNPGLGVTQICAGSKPSRAISSNVGAAVRRHRGAMIAP